MSSIRCLALADARAVSDAERPRSETSKWLTIDTMRAKLKLFRSPRARWRPLEELYDSIYDTYIAIRQKLVPIAQCHVRMTVHRLVQADGEEPPLVSESATHGGTRRDDAAAMLAGSFKKKKKGPSTSGPAIRTRSLIVDYAQRAYAATPLAIRGALLKNVNWNKGTNHQQQRALVDQVAIALYQGPDSFAKWEKDLIQRTGELGKLCDEIVPADAAQRVLDAGLAVLLMYKWAPEQSTMLLQKLAAIADEAVMVTRDCFPPYPWRRTLFELEGNRKSPHPRKRRRSPASSITGNVARPLAELLGVQEETLRFHPSLSIECSAERLRLGGLLSAVSPISEGPADMFPPETSIAFVLSEQGRTMLASLMTAAMAATPVAKLE